MRVNGISVPASRELMRRLGIQRMKWTPGWFIESWRWGSHIDLYWHRYQSDEGPWLYCSLRHGLSLQITGRRRAIRLEIRP